MKQIEKITAPEIEERLPEPLISYIWSLAQKRMTILHQTQYFTLEPELLCGRPIQDVVHKPGAEKPAIRYRVFGCEPVYTKVKVCFHGQSQEMLPVQ